MSSNSVKNANPHPGADIESDHKHVVINANKTKENKKREIKIISNKHISTEATKYSNIWST